MKRVKLTKKRKKEILDRWEELSRGMPQGRPLCRFVDICAPELYEAFEEVWYKRYSCSYDIRPSFMSAYFYDYLMGINGNSRDWHVCSYLCRALTLQILIDDN